MSELKGGVATVKALELILSELKKSGAMEQPILIRQAVNKSQLFASPEITLEHRRVGNRTFPVLVIDTYLYGEAEPTESGYVRHESRDALDDTYKDFMGMLADATHGD